MDGGFGVPFRRRRVEDVVGSARDTTEPRDSRQREKRTCLHDFCYRRVFGGSKVADCAELKEAN